VLIRQGNRLGGSLRFDDPGLEEFDLIHRFKAVPLRYEPR
jgi:hypothetical protein